MSRGAGSLAEVARGDARLRRFRASHMCDGPKLAIFMAMVPSIGTIVGY